jgi:DNA end-binding protein Ku
VSGPVKVLPAVREHTVHFHQVEGKTGSRIRCEKTAEVSGKEFDSSQIELATKIGSGDMVVLESSELDEVAPLHHAHD